MLGRQCNTWVPAVKSDEVARRVYSLVMPRRTVLAPAAYLTSGSWPSGRLADDAPPGAIAAQHVAVRLTQELDRLALGHRELARRAGVSHATIGRAVDGQAYLDMPVLAALEAALGVGLWPVRPQGGGDDDGSEVAGAHLPRRPN